jgi:ribosomal protein S18 acetylase RimI-like enzyme
MTDVTVTRLDAASAEALSAAGRLLPQLSSTAPPLTAEHIERMLASPCVHVFAARAGSEVAGMLTLIVAPIPTGYHGYIEDVVVDEAFRGRGIAERLVRAALGLAHELGAEKVDLTSNRAREAANRLYVRMGFARRDTNVYRFVLTP